MIKLGEGWIAEDHRIFHECGPGLRIEMTDARDNCHCGISVPRRVRNFEKWLAGRRRGVLIDALLRDEGVFDHGSPEAESDE